MRRTDEYTFKMLKMAAPWKTTKILCTLLRDCHEVNILYLLIRFAPQIRSLYNKHWRFSTMWIKCGKFKKNVFLYWVTIHLKMNNSVHQYLSNASMRSSEVECIHESRALCRRQRISALWRQHQFVGWRLTWCQPLCSVQCLI